jgi:hypothetical protein
MRHVYCIADDERPFFLSIWRNESIVGVMRGGVDDDNPRITLFSGPDGNSVLTMGDIHIIMDSWNQITAK